MTNKNRKKPQYHTSHRDAATFGLQKAFLKAFGIKAPKYKAPLLHIGKQDDDPLGESVRLLRDQIHALNDHHIYTQGWMRSALFLGTITALDDDGIESMRTAIWAYTAALIDGIGKLCDNPDVVKSIPENRKFDGYMAVISELRRAVEEQMKLLADIGNAKVEYEKGAEALAYGRLLLKATHAPNPRDTGAGFRGLCKFIGEYGPGGIPDTDWDAAVMLSRAILHFEERRHNAPEAPLKPDDSTNACKCEGKE